MKNTIPLIKYKNVSVNYGNRTILSEISFDIKQGDYVAFTGDNGSGKSTLIKATLGLIPYHKGEIIINNVKVSKSDKAIDQVKNNFGYVPQYTNINRDFPITVREVLKLECEASHCNVSITEHLGLFNATEIIDKKISDLSGGEFQKMLISRAMIRNPQILILDEPVNNLDKGSKVELFEKLQHLHDDHGITIILVSHDHHMIESMNVDVYNFANNTVEILK